MSSAPPDQAHAAAAQALAAPAATAPAVQAGRPSPWQAWALLAVGALAAAGIWTSWSAQQRVATLEAELVKRQQDSQTQAQEARLLSGQAQEQAREAAAHTTLLETRLAEVALQRTQVEDLVKSMSRSRDENLLVDIEASLRVAIQQSVMTGSAEPLVASLQTADDRLARAQQPRLETVRRAVAKDLDRIKATRTADLSTLAIRLDEAIRLIDDMPLISERALPGSGTSPNTGTSTSKAVSPGKGKATGQAVAVATGDGSHAAESAPGWSDQFLAWGRQAGTVVWQEARTLVRVTRIDRPEAMLIAPEQAFFLRENLKLRLLNARLALLSRQTPTALSDLQAAQNMVNRFFDGQSRKAKILDGLLTEVLTQGAQTQTPRPDDTLAALTTLAATR
jgi:uroporphyrin-3 C-methyltransferase